MNTVASSLSKDDFRIWSVVHSIVFNIFAVVRLVRLFGTVHSNSQFVNSCRQSLLGIVFERISYRSRIGQVSIKCRSGVDQVSIVYQLFMRFVVSWSFIISTRAY